MNDERVVAVASIVGENVDATRRQPLDVEQRVCHRELDLGEIRFLVLHRHVARDLRGDQQRF